MAMSATLIQLGSEHVKQDTLRQIAGGQLTIRAMDSIIYSSAARVHYPDLLMELKVPLSNRPFQLKLARPCRISHIVGRKTDR